MRGVKVTEKLWLATSVLALSCAAASAISCASNHRVSPWGAAEAPPVGLLAQGPDLAAQLAAVDQEAEALRLRRTGELRFKLRTGEGEIAVRVATPRGVVMAVGPLAAGDTDRARATELVVEQSGSDLDEDGAPDMVLRNEAGALEVWAIPWSGAAPYRIRAPVNPASKAPASETPAGK
jgi:CelD/BcsL family acetyltransferase involved in cellulose biosynthesis